MGPANPIAHRRDRRFQIQHLWLPERRRLEPPEPRPARRALRENIAKFGGERSKIVSWDQSAGAIAADYLNFAYTSDPIISGMILDSGTELYLPSTVQSFDTPHTNFTSVAVALGCGSAASPIDCLRRIPWQGIIAVLKTPGTTLTFLPIADERIIFSNYTRRYEMGAPAPIPAIIGKNAHEFNSLILTSRESRTAPRSPTASQISRSSVPEQP